MKRGLLFTILIVSLLLSSFAWGNPWYVDPNGDDSILPIENDENNPWQTIKRALDYCSSGDTIELLDGSYVEAVWDTSYSGAGDWKDNVGGDWKLQISVDKSSVTLRKYSGNSSKPSIIGYDNSENLNYIMRIDNSTVKLQNIIFDGYNTATSDSVDVNDAIFITPDADNTEVTNCEFKSFGNEWATDGFYAIVAGGWPDESNTLNGIKINDNTFSGNPFKGQHAHEIYLNYTTNSEIKSNVITNITGAGHPIKFRAGCLSDTLDTNTINGAHFCFIGDYPEGDESDSSEIVVINNTLNDTNTVIDTLTYVGPFRSSNSSSFISEFSGNTVVEGGTRLWEVKSITTDGSKLYKCYRNTHSTSAVEIHLTEFGNHNGPIFRRIPLNDKPLAYKAGGFNCDGSMAYIGNDIFVSTNDGTNIRVYKVNSSTSAIDSTYFTGSMSDYEITAMCPYPNDTRYFITALKKKFSGVWSTKIYKSSVDSLDSYLMYDELTSNVTSVTALGVSGSTLVFGTDKNGTYNIYSGTIPTSGPISPTERENPSYKVTGLTYYSSTLMTAIQEGTTTKIYSGTTSDPIGTLRETYTNTNLISFESDSEFIFMVKDNTSDADEKRTVYFTDSTTDMDQDTIYHSKWYTVQK